MPQGFHLHGPRCYRRCMTEGPTSAEQGFHQLNELMGDKAVMDHNGLRLERVDKWHGDREIHVKTLDSRGFEGPTIFWFVKDFRFKGPNRYELYFDERRDPYYRLSFFGHACSRDIYNGRFKEYLDLFSIPEESLKTYFHSEEVVEVAENTGETD